VNEEWVNEQQVNEVIPEIILSRFAVVQDHDESTGKEEDDVEEDVIIQEDDESIGKEEYYSVLG
jgi:hypothetical protein